MPNNGHNAQHLIRRAQAVIQEAAERSRVAKAWDMLQERDDQGAAKGPLPYNDEAIGEFEQALESAPDDVGLLHHLAIAHHARAWDLELRDDPSAADEAAKEWETALGHWRSLVSSPDFWEGLRAKVLADAPDSAEDPVAEARDSLFENLLDIHVHFVRHYFALGKPELAVRHVEIVRKARIAPALRKRLVDKLFDCMTASVPAACAAGTPGQALGTLEHFLALFPDHLPALRMYAEICKEVLSGMSYRDAWESIVALAERAAPHVRRLSKHPDAETQPLARTALAELAGEMALRGYDRGNNFASRAKKHGLSEPERLDAMDGFERAAEWARLGVPHSASGALVRQILPAALNAHAWLLQMVVVEVERTERDVRLRLRTISPILKQAVAELEEAVENDPSQGVLTDNLNLLRAKLETVENQIQLISAFGGIGGQP